MTAYQDFVDRKTQMGAMTGFDPVWMPDFLFDFQKHLVDWAVRKGRGAIFADCGLGKTPMQLVWAENVVRKINRPVLILTPLAVSYQTIQEGRKFSIDVGHAGNGSRAMIHVLNYQRIHQIDSRDYAGIVCDESSILKSFDGATRKSISRFMSKIPYRLLATATPAPNDWSELGTSSEALGELTHSDMIEEFFQEMDWEERRAVLFNGHHTRRISLSALDSMSGRWRLKGHAYLPFWRWVASWARACRKPSDLDESFSDDRFVLFPLIEQDHVIAATSPPEGMLFTLPAISMRQELDERRRSIDRRCEKVASLLEDAPAGVVWCHLNRESTLLGKNIAGAVEVCGSQTDEEKEEKIRSFLTGESRVLVTKARIAGFGLNLQHCNRIASFASHSFESYYQSIRRCWRYGQTQPVTVDVVWTEGEVRIKERLRQKCKRADELFSAIIKNMHDAMHLKSNHAYVSAKTPEWLCTTQ